MAFTEAERKAILKRDNFTSQLRHYSEQGGFKPHKGCIYDGKPCTLLQVHHIDTQRNGGGDTPDNAITLYECEHNGRCTQNRIHGEHYVNLQTTFVVHPDMIRTFREYAKGNLNAFQEMAERRGDLIAQGILYHNTDHDDEMFQTAKERTETALANGWVWPGRRKK